MAYGGMVRKRKADSSIAIRVVAEQAERSSRHFVVTRHPTLVAIRGDSPSVKPPFGR